MVGASCLILGVTFAANWAACSTRAVEIAPPGLGATLQGLLTGKLSPGPT